MEKVIYNGREIELRDGETAEIKNGALSITYNKKMMKTIWHDEGISMDWDMSSTCYNTVLPGKLWILPDFKNKFDMGK